MTRPCQCIFVAGTAIVLALSVPAALGQSVDVSQAYLRAGHALDLRVRVRTEGAGAAPLPAHCIQAEWIADGQLWTAADTRVLTSADPDPEWTRVRLQHRHRPQDTQAQVRLVLRCGPTYERHFTVSNRGGTAPAAHPARTRQQARSTTKMPAASFDTRVAPPAVVMSPAASAPVAATLPAASATEGPPPSAAPQAGRFSPGETASASTTRKLQAPTLTTTASSTESEPASLVPHRPGAPPPTDTSSPAQAHEAARLLKALDSLQSEHQKTLAKMGVLRARLLHQERSPSTTAWVVLGGLLFLTLAQFGRSRAGEGSNWPQRHAPTRSDRPGRFRLRWPRSGEDKQEEAPAPDPDPTPSPKPHAVVSLPETASSSGSTPDQMPVKPGSGNPWRDADFGAPSLDPGGVEDTLGEVEQLIADGYPAAATITIEQALMHQAGKHPALLLALLDLYEEMGQPWNRERVVAQLEALYNVDAKAPSTDHPGDKDGLEACRRSLDRIQRTWQGAEATSAIAGLLGRPAAVEVLPLSAFREAVWLHRLSSSHRPEKDPTAVELTLEPLPLA